MYSVLVLLALSAFTCPGRGSSPGESDSGSNSDEGGWDLRHDKNGPSSRPEEGYQGSISSEEGWGSISSERRLPSRRLNRRSAGSLDWNVIVDDLLSQSRSHILDSGQDEVSIPDIDEGFDKKYGFIRAHGSFEARDGRVGSLSSIQRTGDVTFVSDPGRSIRLNAHLGFGSVRVRYNYRASIWNLGPSGDIRAAVGSNSVRLGLRMDLLESGTECRFVLEEATVERMDGFDVRISGLGPLDWLTSKIVTWVAEKRRGDIMAKTQRALVDGLTRALERFPCDPAYAQL